MTCEFEGLSTDPKANLMTNRMQRDNRVKNRVA
ncbi:MAG: hypothetical protein ACI9TH_002171 [Kiritimatiellia bacterium]|jgi:hypothetical protein